MPTMLSSLFTILTLLALTSGAQDIRDKVAAPPGVAKASEIIDPDSSIYGIPYGITEDQFIAQFGNSMAYLRLPGNLTGMVYGKTHCFLFAGGKLAGLRITHSVLDWKLTESIAPSTMFDQVKWHLSNGVTRDMTLVEVKQILGDQLNSRQYRWSFVSQRSNVDLDFSHVVSEGEKEDAYKLFGVLITPR